MAAPAGLLAISWTLSSAQTLFVPFKDPSMVGVANLDDKWHPNMRA
jgi:hypothetical protein